MTNAAIRSAYLTDETSLVRRLVNETQLSDAQRFAICAQAQKLVQDVRDTGKIGVMESFLSEYGLSTNEGVALMCLAEAMLRVPDSFTVDELIRDKITPHDWAKHIGDSGSILVNASTWGLLLTGKVLDQDGTRVAGTLRALVRRLGEPVVRTAVGKAMAQMGSQFVLGRSIDEATKRGDAMVAKGYTYSYDMLGEAARTDADALEYHEAYAKAIKAIAVRAKHQDVRENPGISVKLSALHPRYEYGQRSEMLPVLCARLLELAQAAAKAKIGFNIDAEEADRLDISLEVIERVLSDESLAGWDGFGVVVQAFGRRAMPTLDWLYELAVRLDRKIMVRLVKGAYWDQEIKRAQVMGLAGYPVLTRKSHTDVSYLACSRKLLGMTDRVYPQFATHNAHSVAAVLEMADDPNSFEFQRLHGMGEVLHDAVLSRHGSRCRIYAPVGAHRDLLAYLVRRLLENGANSSFVNQIVDETVSAKDIVRDPIALAEAGGFQPGTAIVCPSDIFAPRLNSRGYDITDPLEIAKIASGRAPFAAPYQWSASPITSASYTCGTTRDLFNPCAPREQVGTVGEADEALAQSAVGLAVAAQAGWAQTEPSVRATVLRKVADLYEENAAEIFELLAREAGKTLLDGIAELREAVDFLRYYADEIQDLNTGKSAHGVIVCISPWNFPLAIFTGQIAAALAAGNAVIAKPAEQTPLIAARAVAWMLQAGIPSDVVQLLPGDGVAVGASLTADPRINGVCFTGSTEVAKLIERQLAKTSPDAMFIAETGGINAMIVDSTALMEQATRDIIRGAFQSAGQRCSALRVLYVQNDVREELIEMLTGAMDALTVGDPRDLATDVGPVIDQEAYDGIQGYLRDMSKSQQIVTQIPVPQGGLFVPPTIVKVDSIADVEREIFGPVLHIASFDVARAEDAIEAINATGYGLTFGIHTRIDRRVQYVLDRVHAGNAYVNRDQIGAVVGSQPFGGHGLSGTGPKAGGPYYLPRFQTSPITDHSAPVFHASVSEAQATDALKTLRAQDWARSTNRITDLRAALRGKSAKVMSAVAALEYGPIDLPGPTGEANRLQLVPRGTVLCLGPDTESLVSQTLQALAGGNTVLAIAPKASSALRPLAGLKAPLAILDGSLGLEALEALKVDLIAIQAGRDDIRALKIKLSERGGAIIKVVTEPLAPEQYCHERTTCIDTTAAGGNASLLADIETD
ncbi:MULTISPECIES: bifunctional proline dehydrogenase/L-glutamate gamma-semialdehyde dehydrogenase PutA [Pacificibacter]|uniref:bifunctional proline dehydrogenase/L-glutamate gamma-semialdehyde dehydrogenase PutA n=1 Tax=Pacificibacter TaxID=1042323 RepID=UPI001C09EE4A|nr:MULTISPECIES: bifunctional proline dehydrogenase/L-glutamate gamma-semialdehyde dehydrogenase PutA [Pacificibacter]MBU2935542.1 bifunctional proline dehydrogenase/L-glutamate gamma-semialdehyde dehydrogenase PutA [Pacificibacter marinus]MDO6614039.1 bifunctional proline dehydrogenase/L-glutamate gamma-semialdehyde dehydrogenase PutA [Pacificibacter sp. 1_MG-2023]